MKKDAKAPVSHLPARTRFSLVALGCLAISASVHLQAAVLYWDTSPNAGLQSGNGTWDNGTTAVWSDNTGGSDPLQTWTAGSEAVFQAAGGGVVSVNGAVHADGISITSSGYSLVNGTGGQIVLANGGIIHNTQQATISAPVTGDSLIRKTGSGYLTFNSIDTAYTGVLQVEQGWLGGGPTVANSIQLVVNGGTWGTEGGHRVYGSLSGTGGSLYLWTRTLTVGGNNLSTSYDGNTTFTGQAGYLIKSGTGTLTMNGTLGHTGTDQVNAGSYLINGTHAGGVTVNGAGARLGGQGSIAGAVNIANAGTLSSGIGGVLSVGNLTLQGGANVQYLGARTDTTTLALPDSWNLNLHGQSGSWAAGGYTVLFTYDPINGGFTGTGNWASPTYGDPDGLLAALGLGSGDLSITDVGGEIRLNGLRMIPEPSTLVMLTLGLLLGRFCRKIVNRRASAEESLLLGHERKQLA